MAKITRFNGNLLAFGINATGTNRTVFGGVTQSDALDDNLNTDYFLGWEIVGVNENPTREDFNALGFTHGQILAYLHQMGVPEWNTNQEYHIGSFASVAGVLYESQTNSNIGNDPTADSATNWLPLKDNRITVATITPASDANVTLTRDEYSAEVLVLTDGAWTAARSIIVPNAPRLYHVDNSAGTYTATVKTAAGSGVAVTPGDTLILYCNGVNVIEAASLTKKVNKAGDTFTGPVFFDSAFRMAAGGSDWGYVGGGPGAMDIAVNCYHSSGQWYRTNEALPAWLLSMDAVLGMVLYGASAGTGAIATWDLTDGGASEVFYRSNILGSVSQSGGVPTGAIIERGSNANGEYVRFADGTQICTIDSVGSIDVNAALGSIYGSTNPATWTFPAAFSGAAADIVVVGNVDTGVRWVDGIASALTTANFNHWSYAANAAGIVTRGFAIGRWF